MTAQYDNTTLLTPAGRARLQQELDRLRDEREPQSWQHVRDLRDGAPAEDIEIMLALEEHQRIRRRIAEIERLLAQEMLDAADTVGAVTVGSRVTAGDLDGKVHSFVLVSPLEAGTTRGFISTASPVGVALLGRRVGDQVQVETPSGRRTFTVLTVT
ncbi:MAG: GreA/GreB family elongation factor [Dehalococcoidia bacterium]